MITSLILLSTIILVSVAVLLIKETIKANYLKYIVSLLLLVISTPILASQIIRIPLGDFTIGNEGDWVGFMGNFFGGIAGGLTALIITSLQINQQAKQHKQNLRTQVKLLQQQKREFDSFKEENEVKKKEETQVIMNIINNLLRDEITYNLDIINRNGSFKDKLLDEYNDLPDQHADHLKFQFDDYDRIKFDLMKYGDNQLIKDLVGVYRTFKTINYLKHTENLSNDELSYLRKNYLFWKSWINEEKIIS